VHPRLQSGASTRPLNFTVRASVERPRGVSTLSLVLALIGVSAFGGLIMAPWGQPFRVAPQLLRADPHVTSWLILLAGALYCGATLIAAFALRRMRPWAPTAYICFVCSIALYLAIFMWLVPIFGPAWLGVIFFGLLGASLYWGWRIVRRAFGSPKQTL
jgi:hypothetical protein